MITASLLTAYGVGTPRWSVPGETAALVGDSPSTALAQIPDTDALDGLPSPDLELTLAVDAEASARMTIYRFQAGRLLLDSVLMTTPLVDNMI